MNCYTGDFTSDPELIKTWKADGVPVLHLPRFGDPLEMLQAEIEEARAQQPQSELLEVLGAEIRCAEVEAREKSLREAQAFAQQVHAGAGRR